MANLSSPESVRARRSVDGDEAMWKAEVVRISLVERSFPSNPRREVETDLSEFVELGGCCRWRSGASPSNPRKKMEEHGDEGG